MRGSQIFAGLVIIALLAMGLIYLEGHGYFRDERMAAMGALKPDANAPKPEPPEADQASLAAPSNGPQGMTGNPAAPPPPAPAAPTSAAAELAKVVYPSAQINNPAPTMTNSAPQATNTQQPLVNMNTATTAATTSAAVTPGATNPRTTTRIVYKIVYVDAQGNACRAKRVAVSEKIVARAPRIHHYPRQLVNNTGWIYGAAPQPAPPPRRAMVASTACGLLHQTPNGERVVNLPAGMAINVALDRDLSTVNSVAGEEFSGYLIGPITYCGEVIVPAGAAVEGAVVNVRRRAPLQDNDAFLRLHLSGLAANGFNVPLSAFSTSRRSLDDMSYRTVDYMNDPNYADTSRFSTRDVTLPAQSVVSFSLRAGTAVNF
jgi:enamine deaminase RidA (YjgF/YER057c/UK114 family)